MERLYPLRFEPVASARPWGGYALMNGLGKKFPVPEGNPVGESWELADVAGVSSVVANGPLAGKTIAELVRSFPERLLGQGRVWDRFPLLVKYLNIENKLSVQVHPDDTLALRRYGSLGKAEVWFILDAGPQSAVYMGFNRDVTPAEFRDACKNGTADRLLNVIHPRRGDMIFIKPGTVHAADGGLVVCEIQEPSDLTFRLYDWGRELNPATAREMHLDEALDIIDYRKYSASDTSAGVAVCPQFTVRRLTLNGRETVGKDSPDRFVIYNCIKGEVLLQMAADPTEYRLCTGDTLLVPAECREYVLTPLVPDSELLASTVL
ncbi:MAG: class I mannose-6-phosphate isomerase [Bacteroidales bacterium]|nr:class I mannose-6-phosphate isomerase [Candidatus Cryptobacteroides fimicaballi]